jgi:hypothetical protein
MISDLSHISYSVEVFESHSIISGKQLILPIAVPLSTNQNLFSVSEGFYNHLSNKRTQLALPLYIHKHTLVITVKKLKLVRILSAVRPC